MASIGTTTPLLPTGWLGLTLQGFHVCHRVWRVFRDARLILRDPSYVPKLLFGRAVIRPLANNVPLVREAAHTVLVLHRITQSFVAIGEVYRGYQELKLAIAERPVEVPGCERDIESGRVEEPASGQSLTQAQFAVNLLIAKVRRVATAAFELLRELFFLAMRLADLADACSLDPGVRERAVDEVLINAGLLADEIVSHREEIEGWFRNEPERVNNVLLWVHAPFTAEQLGEKVGRTIDIIQAGQMTARAIQTGIIDATIESGSFLREAFGRSRGVV